MQGVEPLQGMEMEEKEEKNRKEIGKLFRKNWKKCLLTFDLKSFRP